MKDCRRLICAGWVENGLIGGIDEVAVVAAAAGSQELGLAVAAGRGISGLSYWQQLHEERIPQTTTPKSGPSPALPLLAHGPISRRLGARGHLHVPD